MRKFFLIPVLALFTCVSAWAVTRTAGTYAELQDALAAAANGDVIELTADIAYPTNGTGIINIDKSITLDGKGHKISGYGTRQNNPLQTDATYNPTIIAINDGNLVSSKIDVTLKDITLLSSSNKTAVGLYIFDNVDSLSMESITIDLSSQSISNAACVAIFGAEDDLLKLNIENSKFRALNNGYPFSIYRPVKMVMVNSSTEGYGALNMQPPVTTYKGVVGTSGTQRYNQWNGNAGVRGSKIHATNCYFDAPNHFSGGMSQFGVFAIKDDGVDIRLTNCGMNAEELGAAQQFVFMVGGWWTPVSRMQEPFNFIIEGDNSHINGKFLDMQMHIGTVPTKDGTSNEFLSETGARFGGQSYKFVSLDENEAYHYSCEVNFTITGGTYSMNPATFTYGGHLPTDLTEDQKKLDPDNLRVQQNLLSFEGTGYEVQPVSQGGTTVYRVVKKAATYEDPTTHEQVLYDLNDAVETTAEGQNPATSFELSTGGEPMTLNQETTKAGYVQVKDNATEGATTVKVGKVENAGTASETKVDQTLVINNGLDVQGDSKVEVQAGSALVIGEGGIVTSKPENIVIAADENGAASLLLDPAITVNQTPELTVKMTVPAEHAGYEMLNAEQYRHWFRFAMPVKSMAAAWAKEPIVPTFLYGWDYTNQTWEQVGVTEMVPFMGYTLSPDQEITGSNSAITYTFKGQLLGNTDCKLNLNHHGYNFFGNSYTGYISVLKLVEQIMGDGKIDGTVWMWDGEKYQGVALANLSERPYMYDSWQKEVAPMQTFVLRLTGSEFSSTDINYEEAIWGNPRYSAVVAAVNAAPARQAEVNDNAVIRVTIEANNQKESIVLIENNNFSDEYNRGYDAIKYMNRNSFNSYVSVNGENYGTVATDNLEGKMINLKTNNELAYTMTFDFVAGEEYALRDNVTNQVITIVEGATYTFAAQPNSTVEGRFEIIPVAKMPTAVENTEVKADVKGIYTIMGQYVGENFDILPAGVYVVNGVKIVK